MTDLPPETPNSPQTDSAPSSSATPAQHVPAPRPPVDLPPVAPPTTGFFVQLFVLPAVIVFGIMLVWFLFGKLAGGERSIEDYVTIIRSDREDRWKAAHDLSRLLREDSAYARDPELNLMLNQALQRELEAPNKQDTRYLQFLVGTIGSLDFTTGVPLLREAARPDQDPQVRRAAMIALGRLAERLENLNDPNVVLEVREYLKDDNVEIRELAAFTLGLMEDPQAKGPLKGALRDSSPTVRFNAAIALAALNDPAALPTLKEMLDRDTLNKYFTVSDGGETVVDGQQVTVTVLGSINALRRLQSAGVPLEEPGLWEAIEKAQLDPQPPIQMGAKELLNKRSAN